jgi:hypothetical protein
VVGVELSAACLTIVRKQLFFWPTRRGLFRNQSRRKWTIVWITLALAIAGASVVVALSRAPPV